MQKILLNNGKAKINMAYKIYNNGIEIQNIDADLPVMIIHHGGMGIVDHQMELGHWDVFSKYMQVVYIDQRGCGQTDDGDPGFWNMDQFGDDIAEFSKALKLNKPILAGVSAGGYVGIACVTRHPDLLGGLILANTESVVEPEAKKEAYLNQGKRSDRNDFAWFKKMGGDGNKIEAAAKAAGRAAYNYDMNPNEETFQKWFDSGGFGMIAKNNLVLKEPTRVNKKMKEIFANGFRKFDYSREMFKITCPVLWFAGEWDVLHPYSGAMRDAKNLPDQNKVELHVLKSGAPIYLDAKEDFERLTIQFLEKIL